MFSAVACLCPRRRIVVDGATDPPPRRPSTLPLDRGPRRSGAAEGAGANGRHHRYSRRQQQPQSLVRGRGSAAVDVAAVRGPETAQRRDGPDAVRRRRSGERPAESSPSATLVCLDGGSHRPPQVRASSSEARARRWAASKRRRPAPGRTVARQGRRFRRVLRRRSRSGPLRRDPSTDHEAAATPAAHQRRCPDDWTLPAVCDTRHRRRRVPPVASPSPSPSRRTAATAATAPRERRPQPERQRPSRSGSETRIARHTAARGVALRSYSRGDGQRSAISRISTAIVGNG